MKDSTAQIDLLIVLGLAAFAAVLKIMQDAENPKPPAEPFAAREPPTTCDTTPKKGVVLFRDYVLKNFGGISAGIERNCEKGNASHHHEGRAWDWAGVWPGDPKVDRFMRYLFDNNAENFRRLGLQYVIWNRRIFTSTRPEWVTYSGANPHTDHVHISFSWSGANASTSWFQ